MEANTFIVTRVAHFDGIKVTEADYFQVVGRSAKAYSDALTTAMNKFRFWVICGSPDLPLADGGWVELQGYRDDEVVTGIVANDVGPDLSLSETYDAWYEVDWNTTAIAQVRDSVTA